MSTSLYKEKGSKFLGHAIPVSSSQEAKIKIQELRDSHPKAVHVCFAWRFGSSKFEDRFSDDGEPNNSAGKPIFGQIIKAELSNILIAVVRYYGGTNLGVGGLISAYKTAAEEAINAGEIIERHEEVELIIRFSAEDTGAVMANINRSTAKVITHSADQKSHFIQIKIRKSLSQELTNNLDNSGKFDYETKE
ncbi:MAG: putative YigZ family protein [Arenicella sp.]|jgi:uncharacterized YigZ family protein